MATTDPHEQLAMLQAIQDATEAEAWTPATPILHAPLFAAALAGFALVNGDSTEWAIAGPIIGGLALLVALVDQRRKRRVTPGRVRRPLRTLAFYGVILAVTFAIAAMWPYITVTDGVTTGAIAWGWLVTTALFALGITLTNHMSARWTAPPT